MVDDALKVKVLRYAKRYGSYEASRKFEVSMDAIRSWRFELRHLCEIAEGAATRLKVVEAYEVPRQKVLKVTCDRCGAIFCVLPSQAFEHCPSCKTRLTQR